MHSDINKLRNFLVVPLAAFIARRLRALDPFLEAEVRTVGIVGQQQIVDEVLEGEEVAGAMSPPT